MVIKLGVAFARELKNYPKKDKEKILSFIKHVQVYGLDNLEGRNKSSDGVDRDDPLFLEKVRFAVANKLWHYHIGVEEYDYSRAYGDRTSEYILHYINQMVEREIKLVDFSGHPPFRLPSSSYLN